jgi:hypothetical protein
MLLGLKNMEIINYKREFKTNRKNSTINSKKLIKGIKNPKTKINETININKLLRNRGQKN